YWDVIMNKTAVPEVRAFLDGERDSIRMADMGEADSLLWFVYAIQEYTRYADIKDVAEQYGQLIQDIIAFYRKGQHPRARLHHNGLLWVDGTQQPATWMGAVEDGRPITPRTGYVVEINAMWFNAMCFATQLLRAAGKDHLAELMEYQSELTRDAFVRTFWNGLYLNDYVVITTRTKRFVPIRFGLYRCRSHRSTNVSRKPSSISAPRSSTRPKACVPCRLRAATTVLSISADSWSATAISTTDLFGHPLSRLMARHTCASISIVARASCADCS
ncbi:MAG: hypothetical protein J5621_08285, partial [Paludibacteraceae bacterium]|nr:hypothetical protein [Paludibacteraceae bacterium]